MFESSRCQGSNICIGIVWDCAAVRRVAVQQKVSVSDGHIFVMLLLLLFSKNGSTTAPSDGSSIFRSGGPTTGEQHIIYIVCTVE